MGEGELGTGYLGLSGCEAPSRFYQFRFQLVLLLSSVADKTFEEFASTEAIQCTEIYEFVQKLGNKDFEMPFLQVYWYNIIL